MIELTQEELKQHFSEPIFGQIAETADALGMECYVVENGWDVVLMSLFSRISEQHK